VFRDLWQGIWGTGGAAIVSQWPEYAQQYLQRLGGHLDEARRLADSVPAVRPRIAELEAAQAALLNAGPLTRPWAFVRHADWDIARNALDVFRPAMPLTLEGAVSALIGILIGVLAGALIIAILRLPFRGRRSRRYA
jgi:hypothetical protein